MTEPSNIDLPIDHIRADRACIGCGFNLFGQTVTKEPHYNLAIARCPECGVVASLQTYPTMSHWVNRFRALLAGVWIAILIGLCIASVLIFVSFTSAVSSQASTTMAEQIGLASERWNQEQASSQGVVTQTNSTFSFANSIQYVTVTPQWRDDHLDETIALAGGLINNIDYQFLQLLIPSCIVVFSVGVVWSVVLLGGTRTKIVLFLLFLSGISLAISFGFNNPNQMYLWSSDLARSLYLPILAPFMMLYQLSVGIAGIWSGRKIARFVIKLTLPPRLRMPLSIFWTRDGLMPPRP